MTEISRDNSISPPKLTLYLHLGGGESSAMDMFQHHEHLCDKSSLAHCKLPPFLTVGTTGLNAIQAATLAFLIASFPFNFQRDHLNEYLKLFHALTTIASNYYRRAFKIKSEAFNLMHEPKRTR